MSDVEREYKRLMRQACRRFEIKDKVWHVSDVEEGVSPEQVVEWVAQMDVCTPVRSHKQRESRSAVCHRFGGRLLFFKTWTYRDVGSRLKQRMRPGKGRDTWAKGLSLLHGGWLTPRPVAFVEVTNRFGLPLQSIYIGEYWEGAINARHWLRKYYDQLSPENVVACGNRLIELWTSMRDQKVYHADFKLYNLLVAPDTGPEDQQFALIDVDAVRIGRSVRPRDVLRNLAQLNGSLGGWVSEEHRRAWLKRFTQAEPWINESTLDEVMSVSQERLNRELQRIDGP